MDFKLIVVLVLLLGCVADEAVGQRRGRENMNDLMRNKSNLSHTVGLQAGVGYSFLQAARFNKQIRNIDAQYYNQKKSTLPVFLFAADIRFHKRWGGQFLFTITGNRFSSIKQTPLVSGVSSERIYAYSFRNTTQRLGVRVNFHSLANQRFFELMLSPEVGATFSKTKFKTENPNVAGAWLPSAIQPSFRWNAGLRMTGRVWLYRSLGVFIEAGSGVDYFNKTIQANHEELVMGVCIRP